MAFWNRRSTASDDLDEPAEPLAPAAFLALMDQLGQACADEVGRLGGDAEQVLATIWFTETQEVTRVQLTSDGLPIMSGKAFARQLSERAAALHWQPSDSRLDRLDVTVADGRLSTQTTYRN